MMRLVVPAHYFKHLSTPHFPTAKQVRIEGVRYYSIDNQNFISATTLIKPLTDSGIKFWKSYMNKKHGHAKGTAMVKETSETALAIGTKMHSVIEKYLNNRYFSEYENTNVGRESKRLFQQLIPKLNSINNIIAQELALYSKEMEVAGTVDCIAEFEGVPSIIDFKSSKKYKTPKRTEHHFVQVNLYARMWKELTGQEIKQGVILVSSRDGRTQQFVDELKKYDVIVERLLNDVKRDKEDVWQVVDIKDESAKD